MKTQGNGLLPVDRLSRLENFGHSLTSMSYLYRPTRVEQIAKLFELASKGRTPITFRGAGQSYGDASLNAGGIIVDLQRMNRILDWDPDTGVIQVEPGVTIQQLWEHTLEDGWWPPVVPGTMRPTIGGCLAPNVHGKNNWQKGTIGEQVLEFTALLPNGETITCTPTQNQTLFFALIGSMGILGMFTSITLQMKRVYSGNLWVEAWTEPTLKGILGTTDARKDTDDYIVGWIDCTAGGRKLGRGQMHSADYLAPGEDPLPAQSLRIEHQILPDTFLGLVPKSIMHRFMRFFMNNPGVWATNTTKYLLNRTIGNRKRFQQSHVAFNFLLDYIPNWERAYGKGGMIQHQCFIPKENALDTFTEMIQLALKRGLPNYLGVIKRHRPDNFLLSHAVDGFSFAQDFRITTANQTKLRKMLADFDKIALEAGGRFYFAKDSTLSARTARNFLGEEIVQKLKTLKAECDPQGVLESDLYRRCFLDGYEINSWLEIKD